VRQVLKRPHRLVERLREVDEARALRVVAVRVLSPDEVEHLLAHLARNDVIESVARRLGQRDRLLEVAQQQLAEQLGRVHVAAREEQVAKQVAVEVRLVDHPQALLEAVVRAAEQPLVALVDLEADALDQHGARQLGAVDGHDSAFRAVRHVAHLRPEHLRRVRHEEDVRHRERVAIRLHLALRPALGPRRGRVVVQPLPLGKHERVTRLFGTERLRVAWPDEAQPVEHVRRAATPPPRQDRATRRATLKRRAHALDCKRAHAKDRCRLALALEHVRLVRQAARNLAIEPVLGLVVQLTWPAEPPVGAERRHVRAACKWPPLLVPLDHPAAFDDT